MKKDNNKVIQDRMGFKLIISFKIFLLIGTEVRPGATSNNQQVLLFLSELHR